MREMIEQEEQKKYLTHAMMFTLIYQVNYLIDTGSYDDLTAEEVLENCENGHFFDWFAGKFGLEIDLSLWTHDGSDYTAIELSESLADAFIVYDGRISRKLMAENRGLCVLLALLLTILQHGNLAPSP